MCLLGVFRLPEGSAGSHKAVAIKMNAIPDLGGMFPSKRQPGEEGFKPYLKSWAAHPHLSVILEPAGQLKGTRALGGR